MRHSDIREREIKALFWALQLSLAGGIALILTMPAKSASSLFDDLSDVTNMVTAEQMEEHPGAYGIPPEGTPVPKAPEDPGQFFAEQAAKGNVPVELANEAGASARDLVEAGAITPDEIGQFVPERNPLDISGRIANELDVARLQLEIRTRRMLADTSVFMVKFIIHNAGLIASILVAFVLAKRMTDAILGKGRRRIVKAKAPRKPRKAPKPMPMPKHAPMHMPPVVGQPDGDVSDADINAILAEMNDL